MPYLQIICTMPIIGYFWSADYRNLQIRKKAISVVHYHVMQFYDCEWVVKVSHQVYVDNAANRRLGRVGMPLGSMVQSQSPKKTNRANDMARIWLQVHNDLVSSYPYSLNQQDSHVYVVILPWLKLSTVRPACKSHWCKVNPLARSVFGWSQPELMFC